MKQVYLKENGKETTSPTAYIRGWVFFIGLLVWLMAVADSFGQTSTRITNVSTPPTGSCNITASVKLEYLK